MAQFINHFVRVEPLWSYNMIGGLKEIISIDMNVLDDVYHKAGAYLMAKHNFHLSGDAVQYNHILHKLAEHMEAYVSWKYFQYFYDNLFGIISPALGMIRHKITKCSVMVNNTGEVEGFVFAT